VFKPFTTDLAPFAGQSVMIRWRFSSDPAANFAGFFLDEVHINAATGDTIFADGFDGASPLIGGGTEGGDYVCH